MKPLPSAPPAPPALPLLPLGSLLLRINRIALGTAVGIVTLVVVVSSFSLGLWTLADATRAQARVLSENAAAALAFFFFLFRFQSIFFIEDSEHFFCLI